MSWQEIFKQRTVDWIAERVPQNGQLNKIEPGKHYITITLKSLRINEVRNFHSLYYPALHSHISLLHMTEGKAEFNMVTKPSSLAASDSKRLYNIVQKDIPLLENAPYRGGALNVELGLFAIQAQDLANSFLTLLSEMSNIGGVSFVGTAMPYAKPITTGINLLTGNDVSKLEIGLSTSFNPVLTGYYAVVKARRQEFDVSNYHVGNDSRLEDHSGQSLEDHPYFVFEISSSETRPDWFNIPNIAAAYKTFKEAAMSPDRRKAEDALQFLKRTVLLSPDLLSDDAQRLIKLFDEYMGQLYPTALTSTGHNNELKPLKAFPLFE